MLLLQAGDLVGLGGQHGGLLALAARLPLANGALASGAGDGELPGHVRQRRLLEVAVRLDASRSGSGRGLAWAWEQAEVHTQVIVRVETGYSPAKAQPSCCSGCIAHMQAALALTSKLLRRLRRMLGMFYVAAQLT